MAEERVSGEVVGVFALTILLIIGALVIDNGSVGIAVGALVLLLAAFMMFRAPLRYSLLVLMFLALTLENPSEVPAAGKWQSPLFMVGAAMLMHLNNTTGISGLFFSGMDLMLVLLGLVVLYRNFTGSRIDAAGGVPTPKPLVRLAYVSMASIAYVWLSGMVRGGDFSKSLWQLERVVYLPVVFLLFQRGIRGPRDHAALAKVVVAASLVRSLVAIYVVNTVVIEPNQWGVVEPLAYATSHHDSILFACGFVILTALAFEGRSRGHIWRAVLLLPILAGGMLANGRRMVWVQVGLVFVTLYLATPLTKLKRKVRIALVALSPLIALYLSAGWESKAAVFKPVQTIRSVVDPQADASAMTREIENYDLVFTIRHYNIWGSGYGHPYWQIIPLPEMGYELETFIPHNSILGLWVFCGFFGYAGMTLLWVAGVYFGIRAYHCSKHPNDRAAALMSFGVVQIYLVQCYGDMGLGSWTGVFTVAPALAVAGKLAVVNGGWIQPKKLKPSDAEVGAPAATVNASRARTAPGAAARAG